MPASALYDGIIFAALVAIGGVLDSQASSSAPQAPAEIVLAADQTIMIGQIRAVCAGHDAELISANADPASGTSLHLALVDQAGSFVSGGPIVIAGRNLGHAEMHLRCRGDWLMLEMKPGVYTVTAEVSGPVRRRTVQVPEFGRLRVALTVQRSQLELI